MVSSSKPQEGRSVVEGSSHDPQATTPMEVDAGRVSRRSLLAGTGAAILGWGFATERAAALGIGTAAAVGKKAATVIVIGAGMAGMTAAQALRKAGVNVLVIEARDRIGGRIHTDRSWSGVPLDLGASWIHGARTNPLSKLAKEAGIATVPTSYDSSELHVSTKLRSRGMNDSDTSRWEGLVEDALDWASDQPRDVSVAAAVQHVTASMKLSAEERADLDFYLVATFTTEWGLEPEKLSATRADGDKEFADSGDDAIFPKGYDQLVRYLGNGITVRTGVVVRRISATSKSVQIETSKGSLSADAVVVTVPLGVLKSGSIAFDPGLPEAKRHAIETLQMGVLSKTFLRFDRAYWPKKIDWHEFVDLSSGWSEWVSFAKTGVPLMLGFNAGERGKAIEAMSERDVVAEAMRVMREMFGSKIPDPIASKTSSWSTDPFAFGSYSANVVGSTRADRVALGTPVGRVFFAGEATEPDYSSSVHGAHLSGKRVAREVIKLIANKS